MPLVFAATVPHSPVLLPSIGKDDHAKVTKTIEAFHLLETNLYVAKPHIMIVFNPHCHTHADSFIVNAHTSFEATFEEFGDHSLRATYKGSPELAAKLSHMAHLENIPLKLVSNPKIDHGASVPLHYLLAHLPETKVLTIGPCDLPPKDHLAFGKLIKEICMESDKRIALIASADLSHCLTTDAPAGFNEVGKQFDEKIIELLQSHNTTGIATLDTTLVDDSAECGYRTLLLLLGALQSTHYEFTRLAYEAPFGVGYLTGEFVFS